MNTYLAVVHKVVACVDISRLRSAISSFECLEMNLPCHYLSVMQMRWCERSTPTQTPSDVPTVAETNKEQRMIIFYLKTV